MMSRPRPDRLPACTRASEIRFAFPLRETFVWSLAAPGKNEGQGRRPVFSSQVLVFILNSRLPDSIIYTPGVLWQSETRGRLPPL